MKHYFLALAISAAGFLTQPALALEPPVDLVKATTAEVVERVQSEKEVLQDNPGRLYKLVSAMIFPHFDFAIMARLVLGEHWKTATEAERAGFIEEFRKLLVRTYATALLEYSNQTFQYPQDNNDTKEKTAKVHQRIITPGGEPLDIMYRLHNRPGNWLVYDVTVGGVSLIKTYKSSFASQIKDSGVQALIDTLAVKNQDLNI